MRWFAWLVALCLLAAAGVRPQPALTLDRHDASIEDAFALASLVPRRPTTSTTDKRADRQADAAPPSTETIAPPLALALSAVEAQSPARSPEPQRLAASSRGPPATRSPVSHPTS